MRYDSINMHQVRVISHCISLSDQSQSEASPLGYFSIHACESSYTYVNAAYVEAYLLSTFKPLLAIRIKENITNKYIIIPSSPSN